MRDGDDEPTPAEAPQPPPSPEETVDVEDVEEDAFDEDDHEFPSLVGQIPWADEGPERPLEVVFAGSKGGVGRSMLAANVGLFLSRLGREVVVADLDPAGQSVHTFLGLDPLLPKPGSLLRTSAPPRLDRIPGMSLRVCRPSRPMSDGVADPLRVETLQAARDSGADIIILDLGSQADQLSVDAFLEADVGIVVTTPDPAAVERAYAFLRTALYRRLLHGDDEPAVVSRALLSADQVGQLDTPRDLVDALTGVHSNAAEAIRARVLAFSPKILVNRCRNRTDREMAAGIVSALRRRWSISAEAFGGVDNDDTALESLRKRRPLVVEYPGSTVARDIERLARRLIATAVSREARA